MLCLCSKRVPTCHPPIVSPFIFQPPRENSYLPASWSRIRPPDRTGIRSCPRPTLSTHTIYTPLLFLPLTNSPPLDTASPVPTNLSWDSSTIPTNSTLSPPKNVNGYHSLTSSLCLLSSSPLLKSYSGPQQPPLHRPSPALFLLS
jgi:hypothetical protein